MYPRILARAVNNNVRFWPIADIPALAINIRYWG
jgi:hypothetical protein